MGEYRIVRRLSSAATLVESYAGVRMDLGGEQPVMVKRLVSPWRGDAAFSSRFSHVAQHLVRLSHSGVARVLEVGSAESLVCVVEELLDGESVRQVTTSAARAGVRIPPNELLSVVASAAHVLAELHEDTDPLVHGDVNASTIVLARSGGVMLVSTGIARAAGNADGHGPARSEVGSLAPEQLSGTGGAATDVFQLGLLLYELLSGQPLFAGAGHAAVAPQVRAHQTVEPTRMTGAPSTLTALVSRMLARDPHARPPALEVELTLRQLAEQFGWSLSERDAAVLFARVFADRPSLASTLTGPGQALTLEALAAPARPTTTPVPGVRLARITTRRVTLSEVSVLQGALLDEAPPAPVAQAEPPPGLEAAKQLVVRGFITPEQLEAAVESVQYYGGTVVEALVAGGVLAEDTVVTVLAEQSKTPSISSKKLAEMKVPPEVLARLDAGLAQTLLAVPLSMKGTSQLMVAVRDPLDEKVMDQLRQATGLSLIGVRAGPTALQAALARLYVEGSAPTPDWKQSKDGSPGPLGFDIKLPRPMTPPPDVARSSSVPFLPAVGAAPAPEAALSSAQFKLVASALALRGAEGAAAISFVNLAVKTATQLGAAAADLDRLRFAAAAMVLAALSEGKAPGLSPSRETLELLLGDDWPQVEPSLRPVLDGQLVGGDAVALSLYGATSLAAAARAPLGVPGAAQRGYDTLTSVGQLPVSLMQALAHALA